MNNQNDKWLRELLVLLGLEEDEVKEQVDVILNLLYVETIKKLLDSLSLEEREQFKTKLDKCTSDNEVGKLFETYVSSEEYKRVMEETTKLRVTEYLEKMLEGLSSDQKSKVQEYLRSKVS